MSTDVIIATLNEEEGIGPTLEEISRKIDPNQVLVVDGHSDDRTIEIAKDFGATILFQDGMGKGDAVAKAVRYIGSDVDYVVITDADFTYPAGHIPEMIRVLENQPDVGMVCGNRFNDWAEDRALHNLFYFGNKLLAFTHGLLNGVNLHDPLSGLRVIRSEILKNWQVMSKGFDIEVEMNSEVAGRGFGIVEVPIKYRKRLGEKKWTVRDGTTILKRMMLESSRWYL
jgi:glycosyltransferase involved in cell wall biosynthesis